MVRVIHEVEPTCFEHAVGNHKWDNAMDEKMTTLDANVTWELVILPKDKKQLGANGCTKSSTMWMDVWADTKQD